MCCSSDKEYIIDYILFGSGHNTKCVVAPPLSNISNYASHEIEEIRHKIQNKTK
jgi:hypothetical protein